MYTTFRVQNFRGLRDLELTNLGRINLIAGRNNVGKTSLLEALFIFMRPYSANLAIRVNTFRGLTKFRINAGKFSSSPLDSLFHRFDATNTIRIYGIHSIDGEADFEITILPQDTIQHTIIGNGNGLNQSTSDETTVSVPYIVTDKTTQKTYETQITIKDGQVSLVAEESTQRFPTYFFHSRARDSFDVVAERFSTLVLDNERDTIVNALQTIDSRIKSVELLQQYDEPLINVDIGMGRPVPIVFVGEGTDKVLQYILAIGNARGGILLIDEIENGLHYSVQADVWRAIAKAAEAFDVQVFATTHSREMIFAAYEAFKDNPDEDVFRYHRLSRDTKTDEIYATTYDNESMEAADNVEAEVR